MLEYVHNQANLQVEFLVNQMVAGPLWKQEKVVAPDATSGYLSLSGQQPTLSDRLACASQPERKALVPRKCQKSQQTL